MRPFLNPCQAVNPMLLWFFHRARVQKKEVAMFDPDNSKNPKIVHIPVPEIVIYEVMETDLDKMIISGPESFAAKGIGFAASIIGNLFLMFFLSSAQSRHAFLWQFITIGLIASIALVVFCLYWRRSRKRRKDIVDTIKHRRVA
jgi:hypothetical protein